MQNPSLLRTLVKFDENCATFEEEWKKSPIVVYDTYK
jgi:hypothetical protein